MIIFNDVTSSSGPSADLKMMVKALVDISVDPDGFDSLSLLAQEWPTIPKEDQLWYDRASADVFSPNSGSSGSWLKAKTLVLMHQSGLTTVPCCPDPDFRERGDWNPFENI